MTKIMIVDDEEKIVDLLERILKRKNYETIGAVGGEKALAFISSGIRPDLVITDLKMPGNNGVEVLKACNDKKIPIILFTASLLAGTYKSDIEKLGYDIKDVLHKPIDFEMLFTAIKNKLESSNEKQGN